MWSRTTTGPSGFVQTFGLHRINVYLPHLLTSELSLYLLTDARTPIDSLEIKKVPIINDYQHSLRCRGD